MHQVEALALCTTVRNEAPYMLEWLMFHHMFGVELFRIDDNGSDDGTFELLEMLSRPSPHRVGSMVLDGHRQTGRCI